VSDTRPGSRDVTSTTLQVLFIVLMIVAGFWTIRPFLTPLIWAVIIVVATWPVMLRVQAYFRGKRWCAVAVMTVALLMLLVVPLSLAIITIAENTDEIPRWIRSLSALSVAPLPRWIRDVPFLGSKLQDQWQHIASANSTELSAKVEPYFRNIVSWFMSQAGNVGLMILNFLLTVLMAALLFARGEIAASGISRLARRLASHQGENTLVLAAKAVRGVALGVVVTALIQTILGGVGLAVAGVPAVTLLVGILFIFCIAQIGPALVLIPSIVWLYWSGEALSGTLLLAFSLVACTIDNFIRPFLIRKGANLPLVLIFAGVIGGLVAFGIIGLFIGPVVLAVIYTLLQAWVAEKSGEGGSIPDSPV
jgi:predicted PurR-regulated permease PerM